VSRPGVSEARKILRQACHILTELGDHALDADSQQLMTVLATRVSVRRSSGSAYALFPFPGPGAACSPAAGAWL
jgi:hypothetical protein